MENIKVSVIIPCYNTEEYLRQCIDSVLAQSLKEIEIICINDASTDNTAQILKEYEAKGLIRFLDLAQNSGLSAVRNVGIENAHGEYIMFLDSDDYLEPNTFELTYKKAKDNNLQVVYFNSAPFSEDKGNDKLCKRYQEYYKKNKEYPDTYEGQNLFCELYCNNDYLPSACLAIYSLSFLKENGLDFYKGIIHEDNLYTFKVMMLAKRVGTVNCSLYLRRLRDNSIVTTATSMKNVDGLLKAYSELLDFLRKEGNRLNDRAKKAAQEYLIYTLFTSAQKTYNNVPEDKRGVKMPNADILTEHFLLHLIKNSALTKELEQKNKKITKLQKELKRYKKNPFIRLYNIIAYIPRRMLKAARYIKHNGLKKTLAELKKRQALNRTLRQKNREPFVSFILPVYNASAYLKQCIESLTRQKLKAIEIILVDDGSTDNSLEIIKGYADKDSRVKFLCQKNMHAGAARNAGLGIARGEYVVFLDSDDFFDSKLAYDCYKAAKLNNADMVIFGAKIYNNETGKLTNSPGRLRADLLPEKTPFSSKDCPGTLYQITTPCPWIKMFSREFVLKNNLKFQTLHNTNDLYFTYTALALAERIVPVNKCYSYYRTHLSTNLQTVKYSAPLCFYEALISLKNTLTEKGLYDNLQQSFVNRALSSCILNINTAKTDEVRAYVIGFLKDEGFADLDIIGHEPSYYYDKKHYNQLLEILSN